MSLGSDFAALAQGMQKVLRAVSRNQQREVNELWQNSSLRSLMFSASQRCEQRVSDSIVNQDQLKEQVTAKVGSIVTEATNVIGSIQSQQECMLNMITQMQQKREKSSEPTISSPEVLDTSQQELSSTKFDKTEPHKDHPDQISTLGFEIPSTGKTVSESTIHSSSVDSTISQSSTELQQPKPFHYDTASSEPMTFNPIVKPKPASFTQHDRTTSKRPKPKPVPKNFKQQLGESSRERKVPGSRIGRLASFGSLAAGLGMGTVAEIARRGLGLNKTSTDGRAILDGSAFLTKANAERIVSTLCRVRGAALKLGQMLSIQDSSLISPELQQIFERVRQSADFMPGWQMERILQNEFGSSWKAMLSEFDSKPFAAASIGQVHKATLFDGREVAMKIQYPGVASSIDSDINNLMSVLKVWNVLPDGMYADSAINAARQELVRECDYDYESASGRRFRDILQDDPVFYVPEVITELTTKQVLTTELVSGVPLDKVTDMSQETRNWISLNILRLCLNEVFKYNFMQTDPNWSNFLYDAETQRISLLDFGASREYSRAFVDDYIRVIHSASVGDKDGVLKYSRKLGFLTGYESKVMEKAHVEAVMILGEAFSTDDAFDFGAQSTAARVHDLIPIMLKHRLTPPPEETYSLHRKMSGCFLLCTKLKANIECSSLFKDVWSKYEFSKDSS